MNNNFTIKIFEIPLVKYVSSEYVKKHDTNELNNLHN